MFNQKTLKRFSGVPCDKLIDALASLEMFRRRFRTLPALMTPFALLQLSVLTLASCSSEKVDRSEEDDDKSSSGESDSAGGAGGQAPSSTDGLACELGDDTDKCEGDVKQSCSPFLLPENEGCNLDEDCPARTLCFESSRFDHYSGECFSLTAQCVGEPSEKEGLNFGENCDPKQDDCAGKCVQVDEHTFECEEHCRVGSPQGCGVSDLGEAGLACPFFAYDLSDFNQDQGLGDTGICAHLCNCNDDCPGEQRCLAAPESGYAGVCVGGLSKEESIADCDLTQAGGSSGE